MSIDLEWLKLDTSLADHLVDILNRQLENAERPSFIGPVQVTALDFGSNAPDVELVDLRDIYRDFLEDDEDEDRGPVKVTEGGVAATGTEDEEGFEWVSRRAGVKLSSTVSGSTGYHHQFLPPHIRHNGFGGTGDYFSGVPIPGMDPWSSGLSRPPSFDAYGMHSPFATPSIPVYGGPPSSTPSFSRNFDPSQNLDADTSRSANVPLASTAAPHPSPRPPSPQAPLSPENPHPNLQVHLHVNWHSNLRISLQTSLLINYPSPMFMALPIRLAITGLVFNGELAVAYEGERKRVHLCILDDLDPYGPAGARRMSNMGTGSNSSLNSNSSPGARASGVMKDGNHSVPSPELDESVIAGVSNLGLGGLSGGAMLSPTDPDRKTAAANPLGYNPVTYARPTKPVLPIGQRLLPSIFIESEIGQTDKHVLKNVTRVERFIQDVIRRTVEEELVFPNFHTVVIGDPA